MAQTDAFPMVGGSTPADSRTTINDIVAALKSCYSGTSAPTSPSPVAGQYFFNTTTSVLSVYDGTAWRVIGTFTSDYGGLLPRSAGSGQALSGALYCGSQQVKGMANASASTDAVAYGQADARYLQKAGDTMTGNLAMGANFVSSSSTPTADSHLTRKAYVDTKAVAGGTFTGAVNMNSNAITNLPAPSATHHAARQAEITDLLDTSTGHRHDGTDARRIRATDLLNRYGIFAAHTSNNSLLLTTSYQTIASATIYVPSTSYRVLARCTSFFELGTNNCSVRLRNESNNLYVWENIGDDYEFLQSSLEYVCTPTSSGDYSLTIEALRTAAAGGILRRSVFTLVLLSP